MATISSSSPSTARQGSNQMDLMAILNKNDHSSNLPGAISKPQNEHFPYSVEKGRGSCSQPLPPLAAPSTVPSTPTRDTRSDSVSTTPTEYKGTIENDQRPFPVIRVSRKAECGYCGKGFQCDSLKRKHEARHTKPYKCPLHDCERNMKGFTSKNDLSRHINSVHKGLRGNGSVTGYNCLYGSCREKKKIYYRLDNFRNHLKKLHAPQDGLEEFIRSAESQCRRQEGLPSAMDWNPDTASETGSVSASMYTPTSMLERTTIMSDPGSISQCGSSRSRAEDRCVLLPPTGHRPEGLDHRPGGTAQEPMDIDTDHYTSSFPRRSEPSRQFPVEFERIDQRKREHNRRRIQEIKESIQKLNKELSTLENDEANFVQNERLFEGQRDFKLTFNPYESRHSNPIQRYMYQDVREEPNILARLNVSIASRSPAPPENLDFSHPRSSETGYPEVAKVSDRQSFEVPASRKPPSPPETTIESPVQEQRPRTTGEFTSDKGNTERRPCTPPRSILEVSPPSNQESRPPIQEPSKGPEPGKIGPDIPIEGNSKKPGPTKKHPCTAKNCTSSFERPCELRKHMKRHSRPFACTFRNCQKTFGSKNDWKRHENSQHHKLDEWKCDIENETNPPSLCGKLSYRKENFVNHLKSAAHGYTDKDTIDRKTEDCYLGAASGHRTTRFWCGFCLDEKSRRKGTKVPVKNWDERFDHLASHFEKGLVMREFVHDDADQYSDFSSLSDYDNDEESPPAASPATLVSDERIGTNRPLARPEEEKLEKQTPTALAGLSSPPKSKSTTLWYCCKGGSSCDYPGPFLLDNYPSCMTCGHRKCENCVIEPENE